MMKKFINYQNISTCIDNTYDIVLPLLVFVFSDAPLVHIRSIMIFICVSFLCSFHASNSLLLISLTIRFIYLFFQYFSIFISHFYTVQIIYLFIYLFIYFYSQVRGSNENRPKILSGDYIRLRPLLEDIDGMNSRYHPFLMHNFELIGVILSYKLANESAIVEFSLPNIDNILYRPDYIGQVTGFSSVEIINILNEIRYHIRFTFERSGLAFTHNGNHTSYLLFDFFVVVFCCFFSVF